jgi:hypothetical protein
MFLLSLSATCQVWTVSLKAGQSTYNGLKYGLYDIVEDHQHEGTEPYKKRPDFDLRKYVYITDKGKKYLSTLNDIRYS